MTAAEKPKYRAPALEKGLDVLELLAAAREPLSLNRISTALGRSVNELFRMVQVLEYRGYVETSESGGGYVLSNRLFALGISRAPTKDLLDAALPVMRRLAQSAGQSCHLAVASGDQIVVVARVEAPGDLGFSVRVGHHRPLLASSSGPLLYAFQPQTTRDDWKTRFSDEVDSGQWRSFEQAAERAREKGYAQIDSHAAHGVTDLSAPIRHHEFAIAALTVPFFKARDAKPIDAVARLTAAAAKEISDDLAGADSRGPEAAPATGVTPAPRARPKARKGPRAST
jgi:DNA-binding IclR family transcriptional regulator